MSVSIPHPRILLSLVLLILIAGAVRAAIAEGPKDAEGGVVTSFPGAPPTPTLTADENGRVAAAVSASSEIRGLIGGRDYELVDVSYRPVGGNTNAYSFFLVLTEPATLEGNWEIDRCSGKQTVEYVDALRFDDVTELFGRIDIATGDLLMLSVAPPDVRSAGSDNDAVYPKLQDDESQARVLIKDTATGETLSAGVSGSLPTAFRNCPPGLGDD